MNGALTSFFDAAFKPLEGASPALALAALSLATSLLLLLVFRLVSNQEGLRRAKARAVAHILAIRLFPDDPWITVRLLGGALRANLVYLRYTFVPLLVVIVPVILLLIHMDLRFSREPLAPGDAATVGLCFSTPGAATAPGSPEPELLASPGLRVETPALRIPRPAEVSWRVRATAEGPQELTFRLGDAGSFTKEVAVASGRPLVRVSGTRAGRDGPALGGILHPGEPPVEVPGIAAVTVDYPPRSFEFLGLRWHWLVLYFVLSVLLAFALKRPLGVEA